MINVVVITLFLCEFAHDRSVTGLSITKTVECPSRAEPRTREVRLRAWGLAPSPAYFATITEICHTAQRTKASEQYSEASD
jgi:hypothetical protein